MDFAGKDTTTRLTRRAFGGALAGGFAAARSLKGQTKRPNILLVMTSQQRGDCLGSAGHANVQTPVIDLLVKNGAMLRRHFAPAPLQGPSRASLMTGRYPKTHGFAGADGVIGSGERLLPSLLQRQGYQTGLAGAFDLPGVEEQFEWKWEIDHEYKAELAEKFPSTEGDPSERGIGPTNHELWKTGQSIVPFADFPIHRVTDQSIEFIKAANPDRPWFLMAGYSKPEEPFVLPMPWDSRYPREQIAIPDLPAERPEPGLPGDSERDFILEGGDYNLREVLRRYYGAISHIDEQISRVLRHLTKSGQIDNTLVVFTSDNGMMLGEHGRMFAGVPYDGAMHTPAIFYWREHLEPRRIEQVVDGTSLVPTILDLAGLVGSKGFEGASLKPLLEGGKEDPDAAAFSELGFHTIRTRQWKLTLPGDHPTWVPQLFDLAKDPGEKKNLFEQAEVASVRKDLEKRLNQWLKSKPPQVL